MKISEILTEEFTPTMAEMKSEYIAYLVESAFPKTGTPLEAEALMERALFLRLSVIWMGGHNDCVFAQGTKNRSSQ
jgi:hypothetical protein